MEIATPTFDDDAFLHAGGKIRRWGEETLELPALVEPEPTYFIRIKHRRHTYRRIVAVVLGVLALLAIVGLIVGPSIRAQDSTPVARPSARTAVAELSPLLDAKRPMAHPRRVRRGR